MFQTAEGTIKPIVYIGILNEGRLLLVDYKQAPNSTKTGWWIPAPELRFGEVPEEKALQTVQEFGIEIDSIKLQNVESFVTPGGWHLIYHYIIKTTTSEIHNDNVRNFKWVTAEELSDMKDIAHGKWEIAVGKSYFETRV
jgi:ADP-ribose pyrophosphatase YjhB (NUDIX family)